jgi:hypothetical protein
MKCLATKPPCRKPDPEKSPQGAKLPRLDDRANCDDEQHVGMNAPAERQSKAALLFEKPDMGAGAAALDLLASGRGDRGQQLTPISSAQTISVSNMISASADQQPGQHKSAGCGTAHRLTVSIATAWQSRWTQRSGRRPMGQARAQNMAARCQHQQRRKSVAY